MVITSFTGPYRFLSNFSPHPVELPWAEGLIFPTAEHAYQAAKVLNYDDMGKILDAPTPAAAKKAGRSLPLRRDWDRIKRRIMLEVLLAKFTESSELAGHLIRTGQAVLIEGNNWGDTYWGAVEHGSSALPFWHLGGDRILAGHNWLGRELMMVRDVIS